VQRKTIHLQGVGEVVLERSPRARHINLSIKPFKGVRVAVPRGISFQAAAAVAQEKAQWLKHHLDRMGGIERRILAQTHAPAPRREQARRLLGQRLKALAEKHGFTYNRVFVRGQRTRWGSCSSKNNINLNRHLLQLPEALLEYTLLHELVHTRIKSHGPRFWEALEKILPNARALDRELNQHWMLLYSYSGGEPSEKAVLP
jgi:hypothetical protein